MSTAWATHYDPWTTVASAGSVDDADIDYILFSKGYAYFDSLLSSHNGNIRYNVTSVYGLLRNTLGAILKVRYRDNGIYARVIANLKSVNLSSGRESTLFDSTLHYELIDEKLGFQKIGQDSGHFIPYTETMRGKVVGRLPANLVPKPGASYNFKAEISLISKKPALGVIQAMEINLDSTPLLWQALGMEPSEVLIV